VSGTVEAPGKLVVVTSRIWLTKKGKRGCRQWGQGTAWPGGGKVKGLGYSEEVEGGRLEGRVGAQPGRKMRSGPIDRAWNVRKGASISTQT
jgi:hypothetical protein